MTAVRYLSVCSGIESMSVAAEPLGWRPAAFAEIAPFPCAVLAYRFPNVPNLGDFTEADLSRVGPVDVLGGGTPCQSFSVAGKGLSLADARGNLTLSFTVLAHEFVRSHGLRNLVWENVPGIFSKADNPFGCFLGALVGHDRAIPKPRGAGWPDAGMADGPRGRAAWRVFDAQHFGLAQRRARVFVVADFGNGADPAKVLFERQGVRGDFEARGAAREDLAGTLGGGSGGRGWCPDLDRSGAFIASHDPAVTLTARERKGALPEADLSTVIAHTLRGEGFDASEDGTGHGAASDLSPSLQALNPVAVAFDMRGREGGAMPEGPHDTVNIRAASGGSSRSYVASVGVKAGLDPAIHVDARRKAGHDEERRWVVRRLTPRECERLQGFPDDWTLIPWRGKSAARCPDGPRYAALGNAWAVPVARWILARIDAGLRKSAMPGLVPGIHALADETVDGRVDPRIKSGDGHDENHKGAAA